MNKTLKKTLSVIITILLIMTSIPVAFAAGDVNYIDCSWDGTKVVHTPKSVSSYTVVGRGTTAWNTGWYVVNGEVTISSQIMVSGDVRLILADGAYLNAQQGITVNEGNSLTIYSQSLDAGMGKLRAAGIYQGSGIGGADGATAGTITICGGTIEAEGTSEGGAAIGGGWNGDGGTITIYDGSVTASGKYRTAGIGGGIGGNGGAVTINGGTVTATTGRSGAGIGSGDGGDGDTVTINGGTVTTTGGYEGAGIGGGESGNGGTVRITGGTVTATGGYDGAGIGGGGAENGGTVTITGGTVTAAGRGCGAGIGGGRHRDGGIVTITGGTVAAKGGGYSAADIGAGGLNSDPDNGTLTNGKENVSLVVCALDGVAEGTAVTGVSGVSYGIKDITTQDTNKLYLYLPAGSRPTYFTAGDAIYCGGDGSNVYSPTNHSPSKECVAEGDIHHRLCELCGTSCAVEEHNGGEGTCLNDGVCADCGVVYILANPDNHVTEDTYIEYINDSNHGLYHSCCKALVQEIPHSPKEGQEATCVGVAVCADCGFAYGGNDSTNHISDDLEYVSAGKGMHILTHACCGNPAAAAEGHNMSYTVNGELTIDGVCEDCGATGSVTLNPTEGGTYNGYAFVSEYSGTGILGGLDAFEKPVISGCCEDGCSAVGEHTVTMTMDDKSVSATFTVAPKELIFSQIKAFSKEYDGNSVVGVYGIDLEGIVVYKEGDYPDAMWDDVHDDVSLSYDNLLCMVDDVVPGTYETAKLSGVALKGNDAHNYVIAESFENVPLIDSNGYEYTIRNPIIHLEALDQFLVGDAELDQNEYIADGLREQFTMEGVLLYASGTSIEVDIDNIIIRFNGEDVTEYFEIWTYSGTLSRVCEGHEFDENGFCSTGQCDSYEPADKNVGTDEWGMEVEYYDIYNAGQLYWFAEQVNVYGNNGIYGRLMDNITVNEDITAENLRQWTPIGGGYTAYVGNFDGQGYTVSGLYFNDPEATMVGLFGYTDYAYVIKDVHVSNSYFKANSHVGALIGSSGSIVSGCTADGTVTVEGETYRGGLIGYTSGGEVKNSWSAVVVPEGVGGIVGYNCATVTNCYTTAYSLVGVNTDNGSVSNCYYLSDAETEDGGKTAEQFASGEVAYLLQSGVAAEEIYDDEGNYVESVTPHIWGQKIGSDDYPVLGGDKVYLITNCNNESDYSNENINNTHDWSNKDGVCANGCGTQCSHEGITDGECDICKAEFQASVTDKDGNEIGTYKTFDEAFTVAQKNEDSIVMLLKDVTIKDKLEINSGKFTLELNGKTITTDGSIEIVESAELTVDDDVGTGKICGGMFGFLNDGSLIIHAGKIEASCAVYNYGTINIVDGELDGYITNNGTVIVDGGTLTYINNVNTSHVAVVKINGGTFTDANTIVNNDGEITVKGGIFPNGFSIMNEGVLENTVNSVLASGYVLYDELGNRLDVADDATAIDGYVKVAESATKIFKVAYTPSADTHNTFTVTVDGRPTMIQFIEEDGGTRTYDRNNKNVTITAYDADGNEVSSLDRTAAYEVWTIYTNLIGPKVKMRAKYIDGADYKWEKNTYDFTLEFAEPVYDTNIYQIYVEDVKQKGPATVMIAVGADVQGVRFKMPNGTTTTYYADGAEVIEDGILLFTGKVWINESGENIIEVYIRSQNTWTYCGYYIESV